MASGPLNGRGKGSRESASGKEDGKIIQPPDLRQVTVLRRTDWNRVQDKLSGVNEEKQCLIEAAKQREALHLQSKEVVKLWSNTISGQRQKKLEAKKIREETEEEKVKQIAAEEAKYQEQKRQEEAERARTELYYQTYRVKGLHRALLLTEVLKEREAQIELKQKIKSASKDVDKRFLEMVKLREDEALRQEKEKALQRKLEREAAAEDLKNQIKAHESEKEQQKLEIKKDAEEIQRLKELHQLEQRMESERQANQKRDLMQAHLEHMNNQALIKKQDAQKQKAEQEQRNLFILTKKKMMKLRKEKEKELFREDQLHRERIMNKLSVTQNEQTAMEEQRIAKAVAEREAKQAQLRQEEEKKKSDMLKLIAAHREFMRKEKEQRDKMAQQETQDALQAKKEADRMFSERQKLKAEKTKEEQRKLQDFYAAQLAEKSARRQRLKELEQEFEAKNAQLVAEEEARFQQYSQQVIGAAAEAKRTLFPLLKVVRGGTGGGHGGVRPTYIVHDSTGSQMPKYVTITTENIKKLRQPADIQLSKMRLGLIW